MRLLISDAVKYFGRAPRGYGGRSALAKLLEISSQATYRWKKPYVPQGHADFLFSAVPALRQFKRPKPKRAQKRSSTRSNVKPARKRTPSRKTR